MMDDFRISLVKLFGKDQMKKAFSKYCRSFPIQECAKKSAQALKRLKKRNSRRNNPDVLQYEGVEGYDIEIYPGKFELMNPEEKMKELKEFEQHEEYIITRLMENTPRSKLEIVAEKYLPDLKILSKVHLIQELMQRYFWKLGNLDKREIEKDNMKEMSFDTSFEFVTLSEVEIPVDIIRHIFSYLRYDILFLQTIGGVCSSFYITCLLTWPSLSVSKEKVYQISLVVLQNVRSLTLVVGEKRSSFRNAELDHLFSYVNPDRLHSLYLDMPLTCYIGFLRYMNDRKGGKSCMRNVKHFELICKDFNTMYGTGLLKEEIAAFSREWENYDQFLVKKPIRLKTLFPALEVVKSPLSFGILEGLEKMKSLTINLLVARSFERFKGISHPLGFIGTEKRDFGLGKEKVKCLEIRITIDDSNQILALKSFLEGFVHLNILKLDVIGRMEQAHHKLNFQDFRSCLPSLEEIHVFDGCIFNERRYGILDLGLPPHEEYLRDPTQYAFPNLTHFSLVGSSSKGLYIINDNLVSKLEVFTYLLHFPSLKSLDLHIPLHENKNSVDNNNNMLYTFEKFRGKFGDLEYLHLKFECIFASPSAKGCRYILELESTRKKKRWKVNFNSFRMKGFVYPQGFSLKDSFPFLHALIAEFCGQAKKFVGGRWTTIGFHDGEFRNRQNYMIVSREGENKEGEDYEFPISVFFKEMMRKNGFVDPRERTGKWAWSSFKKITVYEVLNDQ